MFEYQDTIVNSKNIASRLYIPSNNVREQDGDTLESLSICFFSLETGNDFFRENLFKHLGELMFLNERDKEQKRKAQGEQQDLLDGICI